jgi:hypothetical protein
MPTIALFPLLKVLLVQTLSRPTLLAALAQKKVLRLGEILRNLSLLMMDAVAKRAFRIVKYQERWFV